MIQGLLRRAAPLANDWDKRWFEVHSALPKLTNRQMEEAKIRLTKYLVKINGGGVSSSASCQVASHNPPPSKIQASDNNFLISLTDDMANNLLKLIPGFHYVPREKKYAFPIRNVDLASIIIESYDMRLAKELLESQHTARWRKREKWKEDIYANIADTREIIDNYHHSLGKYGLLPHQVDTIAFIEAAYGKALITHSPGLGKSAPAILYNHFHNNKTIVMCPKNVLMNWAKEIRKWVPDASIHVFTKETKKTKKYWWDTHDIVIDNVMPKEKPDYFIINYDVITKQYEALTEMKFPAIILDECHELKSWKADRTQSAIVIAMFCTESIIGLSGTPLRNRPAEFFLILHLIAPTLFPERKEYLKHYCGAEENSWGGLDLRGATNMDELSEKLKSIMLRRTKEVLTLPQKHILYKRVPLKDPQGYKDTQNQLLLKYANQPGGPLKAIQEMKLEAVRQKIHNIHDYIKKDDLPLIIFYHHKEVGNYLTENLKEFIVEKIDGSVGNANRTIIIDKFQNGEVDILLASITAAGMGINLTASSNVIMLEQAWSPTDELQAHDRVHRIGQTNDVEIIYLLGENTIDEAIYRVVQEKRNVIDNIVDGESIKSVIVRNVLQELRRR